MQELSSCIWNYSDIQVSSQELGLQEWSLVNDASSRTRRLPGMKRTFTVQSRSVFTILPHFHTTGISDPQEEIPVLIPSSMGGRPLVWSSIEISQINHNVQTISYCARSHLSKQAWHCQDTNQAPKHQELYLCLITSIVPYVSIRSVVSGWTSSWGFNKQLNKTSILILYMYFRELVRPFKEHIKFAENLNPWETNRKELLA